MSDEWDDLFALDEDEDLDQTSSLVDDFETDFFEDEEQEGGLNRSFLLAGLLLIATFVVIIIAILLLLGQNNADEDQKQTDAANIVATNSARETERAAAQTQIALDSLATEQAAGTQTADAIAASQTANAQTVAAYETSQALTATARSANATGTIAAEETIAMMTATFLTPPQTATPTEPMPVTIVAKMERADGQAVQPGTRIRIYEDNGDGVFNPPPTPTPIATPTQMPSPSPTWTPFRNVTTATATSTGPIEPTQTIDIGDGSLEPDNLAATNDAIARATQASAFDATSTARAQQRNTPVATTPPPADTPALTQLAVGGEGSLSVSIPESWQFSDRLDNQGIFFFGDSAEAIDTRARATLELDAQVPRVGLGGQIVPQTLQGIGATEVTPELLQNLLQSWIVNLESSGGQIVTSPVDVEGDGYLLRYAVSLESNEQGYLAYIGFEDSVAFVTVTATIDTFEPNRDLLFEILQSIRIPAAGSVDETTAGDEALQAIIPRRSRNQPAIDYVYQGGPTPTPGDEDAPIGEIVVGPDGTFILELPPGIEDVYIEMDLTPGTYTLEIEGRPFTFTVPDSGSIEEEFVITDRTVTLIVNAVEEVIIDTPTPSVSPTFGAGGANPFFLQTSTAAAQTRQASVTQGPTVTAIPNTGLFSDGSGGVSPGRLTLLAIIGAGLVGVVFVVRRLRATV